MMSKFAPMKLPITTGTIKKLNSLHKAFRLELRFTILRLMAIFGKSVSKTACLTLIKREKSGVARSGNPKPKTLCTNPAIKTITAEKINDSSINRVPTHTIFSYRSCKL